jgi:integrase
MTKTSFFRPPRRANSGSSVRLVRAGSVTVKIYTINRQAGLYYSVCWYVGPKRHTKNFQNFAHAEAYARERAEALAAGQVHGPQLTTAQAQDTKEALRRLGPVDMPLHVVAGEYADLKRTIGERGTLRQAVEFYLHNSIRPEMERTVTQVVEEFTASRRANGCCQLYIDDCRLRLGAFGRAFAMPITHLITSDMEKWLGQIAGLTSRNDARRLIITMFNWARRRGYLPRDRETEAKWLEKPRIKPKPIVIFTPGELRELLEASDGQARLGLALGAFTGIRSAELLRLRWENFNWEEGIIDLGVDQTKTASRRLVPIRETLKVWLAPFVKESGEVFKYSLPVCLAEAFATAAKKATKVRQQLDPEAPPLRWKINGLRHSYASYRVAETEDVAQVSLEMGNSPQKIFSNYRKVVTKARAMEWFSILPSGEAMPPCKLDAKIIEFRSVA